MILYVLFDGVCNFCIRVVSLIQRKDRNRILIFLAIQSVEGRKILHSYNENFISLNTIYFIENGKLYQKSKAVFRIFAHLPFPWKIISLLGGLPTSITDRVYGLIAHYRYLLAGRRDNLTSGSNNKEINKNKKF